MKKSGARYGIIAGIVGAGALWGGGQNLYVGLANSEPTSIGCEDLADGIPDEEWLEIEGCMADLTGLVYSGSESSPSEIFIPLRDPEDEGASAVVVLASKDPELLEVAAGLLKADTGFTEEELEEYMIDHFDEIFLEEDFSGLVKFGIELDDEERAEIGALGDDLDEDFILLEHNAEPQTVMGLFMLLFGLAAVGFAGFMFLRARG